MKFTICHAKLCKGTKNKSLLNTAQKIISNYIRANSKVSVCVGSPGRSVKIFNTVWSLAS